MQVKGDRNKIFGDLNEDNNVVIFFQAVLDRRDHLEEKERISKDIHRITDTLGASSTLGISGIWTRQLVDSVFLADKLSNIKTRKWVI